VREEVEENLLIRLGGVESGDASLALGHYAHLIELMKPELVAYPGQEEVKAARHLIRHAADVPCCSPRLPVVPIGFSRTTPTFHARRCSADRLRIATPVEFFSCSLKDAVR